MTKLLESLKPIKFDSVNSYKGEESNFRSANHLSKDGARIANSGKIYRHLFDSEVQLINALEKIRKKRTGNIEVIVVPQEKNVFSKFKILPPSINKEVSLLPENVASNKNKSEVISKVVQNRKSKFDDNLLKLQNTLGEYSDETNAAITQLCSDLYAEFTHLNAEMDREKADIDGQELINLTRERFTAFGRLIQEIRAQHHNKVTEFHQRATKLEETRLKKITKFIAAAAFELERIGHFPPTEVHRFVVQIICDLNMEILRNREALLDMKTKLTMITVNEDRKRQVYLKNKLSDWKLCCTSFFLKDLEDRILQEQTSIDSSINRIIQEVNPIFDELSELLQAILLTIIENIDPETVTKSSIDEWNNKLINFRTTHDKETAEFAKSLRLEVEQIHSRYLAETDTVKAKLVLLMVYEDPMECSEVVDATALPLIGSLHRGYENCVEKIETMLDEAVSGLGSQTFKVGSVLASLLELWSWHTAGLDRLEEGVLQRLVTARNTHQSSNLGLENALDSLVDQMRQGTEEAALKEDLRKCDGLLDKIKANYQQFNTQQISVVKRYPTLIETEINRLQEKLEENFEEKSTFIQKVNDELDSNEDNRDEEPNSETKDNGSQFILKLKIIDLSNEDILKFWKSIQNFYVSYLEDWQTTVYKNANKVITSKTEEFESELRLRLHLHEPRPRRLELDVHNVRVAELSIHAERVGRQLKFVETALAAIRDEYVVMDLEQRARQDRFQKEFTSVSDSSTDVSSQSKLKSIRQKLNGASAEYMKTLRLSLRDFRHQAETKLQDIRKSNAQFVCSFKLFSDGGNFCPDEIANFTRKVEKVNQKVDDVEGEIMSNLEIVEKHQNDFVAQQKATFEDKFKHHIVDIAFLEKVTRAMADLQIKIKAEVANSNSQSKNIFTKLRDLYGLVRESSANKPHNSDIDQFINPEVQSALLGAFTAVNDRSVYLECLRSQTEPEASESEMDPQTTTAPTSRVHFTAVTALSKVGKQPTDDVGFKTVKEILKLQNEYLHGQSEVVKSDIPGKPTPDADRANTNSSSRANSVRSDAQNSLIKSTEKSKSVNKTQLQDKKLLLFGDEDSCEKPTFFSKIRSFCRTVLDGLLHAAEIYYRHKGARRVTQASLEDSLDAAVDNMITRIKGFYQQTDDYRAECLKEFNRQLGELEKISDLVPDLALSGCEAHLQQSLQSSLVALAQERGAVMDRLATERMRHTSALRPDLGRPDQAASLTRLCEQETSRATEEATAIADLLTARRSTIYEHGRRFVHVLASVTEDLFLLMDNLLTCADVINAVEPPKPEYVPDLVRKTQPRCSRYNPAVADDDAYLLQRKGTWVTDDLGEILRADPTFETIANPASGSFSLITAKTTLCHLTVLRQRTTAVETFKKFYFEIIAETEEMSSRMTADHENYKIYWQESIESLTLNIN